MFPQPAAGRHPGGPAGSGPSRVPPPTSPSPFFPSNTSSPTPGLGVVFPLPVPTPPVVSGLRVKASARRASRSRQRSLLWRGLAAVVTVLNALSHGVLPAAVGADGRVHDPLEALCGLPSLGSTTPVPESFDLAKSPGQRSLFLLSSSVSDAFRRGLLVPPAGAAGGDHLDILRQLDFEESELFTDSCEYGINIRASPPPSGHRLLTPGNISLPSPSVTASVPLVSALSPPLAAQLADPSRILLPTSTPGYAELRHRARHGYLPPGAAPGQHPAIMQELAQTGMTRYLEASEVVAVNSYFGVDKAPGAPLRFILNGTSANSLLREPDKVSLPSPSLLADLHLPEGETLFLAKTDLSDYFYTFQIPEYLVPYFCLPPVSSTAAGLPGPEREVFPALVALPMGCSWSMLWAQDAHMHCLLQSESPFLDPGNFLGTSQAGELSYSSSLVLSRDRPFLIVYCDDLIIGSLSRLVTVGAFDAACAAIAKSGFHRKPAKDVLPPPDGVFPPPVVCLGFEVTADGKVLPKQESTLRLLLATRNVVQGAHISPHSLSKIVGSWVWLLLIARPLLSILDATFSFLYPPGSDSSSPLSKSRVSPPIDVRNELYALMVLSPFMVVDMTVPFLDTVVAFDASSTGTGVSYTRASPEEVLSMAAMRVNRGAYTAVTDLKKVAPGEASGDDDLPFVTSVSAWGVLNPSRWRTAVSSAVRYEAHINKLELRTGLTALDWVSRQASGFRSRAIKLSDSMVSVGALAKGRSSSRVLNRQLRRYAAMFVATFIRSVYAWLPTWINPADEPSRRADASNNV